MEVTPIARMSCSLKFVPCALEKSIYLLLLSEMCRCLLCLVGLPHCSSLLFAFDFLLCFVHYWKSVLNSSAIIVELSTSLFTSVKFFSHVIWSLVANLMYVCNCYIFLMILLSLQNNLLEFSTVFCLELYFVWQ